MANNALKIPRETVFSLELYNELIKYNKDRSFLKFMSNIFIFRKLLKYVLAQNGLVNQLRRRWI